MQQIGAIAAMTRDRIIGLNNRIPWHYSEDFKRFKKVTLGSNLIMGRKTWESIGSKPLPKRRNIVISRNFVEGAEHYQTIQAALTACKTELQAIWFIGGGEIYAQAMPYCDLLDITIVPDDIGSKDAILFPEIDEKTWCKRSSHALTENPKLQIVQYLRIDSD
jgi:dihydrofolate reductase